MARIILEGKTYPVATVDRLTLRDLLMLERETEEFGRPMKWSELQRIVDTISEAIDSDDPDVEAHDDFPWFLGILVWAARRDSGEAVTFAQAVDFPLGDFHFVADPEDRRPPQKARPGKSTRKGSGPGAGGRTGAGKSTKKTSASQSSVV